MAILAGTTSTGQVDETGAPQPSLSYSITAVLFQFGLTYPSQLAGWA